MSYLIIILIFATTACKKEPVGSQSLSSHTVCQSESLPPVQVAETISEPPATLGKGTVASMFADDADAAFGLTGDCTPSTPAIKPRTLTPEEELFLIRKIYDDATIEVKKIHPGLGMGWRGNVTGYGPKCDVVHAAYQKQLQKLLAKENVKLRHYVPVTIFDSGWLPGDIAAHVYMGIGIKSAKFSEQPVLVSWTDPWRYGKATQYKPGTGPNTPDQIIPE